MTRSRPTRWLAALLVACCGCAGISIAPVTAAPVPGESAPVTLVLGELAHAQTTNPLYASLQRAVTEGVRQSAVASNLLSELDLPAGGVSGEAYLLRYRITEDELVKTVDGDGCLSGLLISGAFLVVPLFFLGLCTYTFEHRLTVEARLFDVSRANTVKTHDLQSNELVNSYDPATFVRVVRKEYRLSVAITVESDQGRKIAESPHLRQQVAEEAARQLVAQSVNDLAGVLRREGYRATREP